MNKLEKISVKNNEVANHIASKFGEFAKRHQIDLLGTPAVCEVKIYHSAKNGSTQNMAVPAQKGDQTGFLINVGGKKLMFFGRNLVSCTPLKDGSKVFGHNLMKKTPQGVQFASL